MTRSAYSSGRRIGAPTRSLLAVALLIATSSAWAQEAGATAEPVSSEGASAATPPPPEPATLSDPATPTTEATATTPATQAADAQPVPSDLSPPTDPAADAPPTPPSTTGDDTAIASDSTVDPSTPPQDANATTETPTNDADATAAEADFDALYGPTGSTDVGREVAGVIWDPWEPYNRKMHTLNNAVDRYVAHPLAKAYVAAVPRPVRSGVSNFFSNLGQPITAINALLQGKPKLAAHAAGRFLLNSTLGIGGIFDPATDAKLENGNEDFGQSLGVWGWKRSRYVELPLFGPRTFRDIIGMVGDAPLSPMRGMEEDKIRIPLQGLQLVDLRAQLMSTDALREGVQDDYTLVRDAWMQRRRYQIDGGAGENLPDYLRDAPIVPVNAMPVRPGN